MNVTLIGFGNIAHAFIAESNLKKSLNLNILTNHKTDSKEIINLVNSKKGYISKITNNPKDVIPKSDIVIFTTPSFAIENWIKRVYKIVPKNTLIGAFPGIGGFDETVKKYIKEDINIFSTQRAPYIARVVRRGYSVNAYPKDEIFIAVEKNRDEVKRVLEELLDIKVNLLDSFLEVNLSNSNPILHSARLYELFKNNSCYNREIFFYKEWDNSASEMVLNMDSEFMQIVKKLNLKNIKSLKEHYGINSIEEMTKKMTTIESFKNIKTPMILKEDMYYPDINSRYFTEDIKIGLSYIKNYAKKLTIDTPNINMVHNMLMELLNDRQ